MLGVRGLKVRTGSRQHVCTLVFYVIQYYLPICMYYYDKIYMCMYMFKGDVLLSMENLQEQKKGYWLMKQGLTGKLILENNFLNYGDIDELYKVQLLFPSSVITEVDFLNVSIIDLTVEECFWLLSS